MDMALSTTDKENLTTESEDAAAPESTTEESRWKSLIFIPLVFLYMFSNNVISTPLKDVLMDRICMHNLNYSTEVCKNRKNYTDIEDEVQVQSTQITLYSNMIQIFPSACLSVFIGPWSDKYGRKTPMYVSLLGSMLYDVGIILYGVYPNAPTYVLYLASIPNGLTGAAIAFLGCSYSLASDSSDYRLRTRSFAMLQIAVGCGTPLGGLVSGYLYNVGSVPVFSLGLATHFASVVYLFFFIKDRGLKKEASMKIKIMDFFSLDNLKENVRVLLKKRENKGTTKLVLVTLSSAVIYLNYTTISDVLFPFCKKMYDWSVTKYSTVVMIYAMSSVVGLSVAIPVLLIVLKVTDAWLGAFGTFFLIGEHTVKAFAYYPWLYYISLAISVMGGVAPFAPRVMISKSVDDDEVGCVFAAVSTLENLIPIVGGPLFTGVYTHSISFFPGLVFLVAAVTMLFPFAVFIWLIRVSKGLPKKIETKEEEDQTSESPDRADFPAAQ